MNGAGPEARRQGAGVAKKKAAYKVVNPLFEKRPKQFGIGGALPHKKAQEGPPLVRQVA